MASNSFPTAKFSRRDFLKISAAAAALATCSRDFGVATARPGSSSKHSSTNRNDPSTSDALAWLAANRLMFGPRPGGLAHIAQIGIDAFIEEQLAFAQLDDGDAQRRIDAIPELHDTLTAQPKDLAGGKKREIILDLQQATMLRAIYSQRQLYEVMTDFWSNHFKKC